MIFSFFDFSTPFYFLLIEFHCSFFISYKILPFYVYNYSRGRVDDFSFFDCSSPFFLSIEFHCTFSISYKILPYFVYYYCLLIW